MKTKNLIVNGKSIHYDRLHGNLRMKYGRADHCQFCGTDGEKRFEWALRHGCEYSMNINDYIPLCPSCHRKYDMTESFKKKCSMAKKGLYNGSNNPAARKVIDEKTNKIFGTVTEAADYMGMKKTTLIMMLKGVNKNKTNLKYYEQ